MNIKLGPIRIHNPHLGDYMKRWLFETPWFTLRVHKICKSDNDRHLHDHPWDFTSLILTGGYLEDEPTAIWMTGLNTPYIPSIKRTARPPFTLIRHKAEDLHKLTAMSDKPIWTLVVTGPKRRQWGFLTPHGWVEHTTYHQKYQGFDLEAQKHALSTLRKRLRK